MRADYKIVTDLDLSSNIIANVSKIVGNDYTYSDPVTAGQPTVDFNDLIITTCDSSISENTDKTAANNTGYRGDVLIRAGVDNTLKNSGYVHIFANSIAEPNANKSIGEDSSSGFTDYDGIRVYPSNDIRLGDARIRSYFTDEFEIHGAENNSDTFHTTYKVNGKFTDYALTEGPKTDNGDDESGTSASGNTVRTIANYIRLNAITDDNAGGFIDIDTKNIDLYSSNEINIHTASRGTSFNSVAAYQSGTPSAPGSNRTTLTTEYLQENIQNIVVDNAGSYVHYAGNKFEVFVGEYTPSNLDEGEVKQPKGSDENLYLKIANTANSTDESALKVSLHNDDNGNSWTNKDDWIDVKADLIRITADSNEDSEANTDYDGLIQLNAGYLDVKVDNYFGLTLEELDVISKETHIRTEAASDQSGKGNLHLLVGDYDDEDTLKGVVLYYDDAKEVYDKITLGTSNVVAAIPSVFKKIDNTGKTGSVSTAFLDLHQDEINYFATNSNFDIDDYLQLKAEQGSATSVSSDFNRGTSIYSILKKSDEDQEVSIRTGLEKDAASGSTTLDIRQGVVLFRTDSFMSNIRHNFEIKLDNDIPLDLYLDEYNDNDITTGITSSTDSSGLLGKAPHQRKFSIAREHVWGKKWDSEKGSLIEIEDTDNVKAVVGRLDNLKVNKVFNMGMNKDKFSIYWDEDTSSLVFTQGEILWQ